MAAGALPFGFGCQMYQWAKQVSVRQRTPYGLDDAILDWRLEIGVHRQAEHLFGEAIAHRHSALGERKVPISRLAMQRPGVIDRGWNALCPQRGGERVALTRFNADRILRPD